MTDNFCNLLGGQGTRCAVVAMRWRFVVIQCEHQNDFGVESFGNDFGAVTQNWYHVQGVKIQKVLRDLEGIVPVQGSGIRQGRIPGMSTNHKADFSAYRRGTCLWL